MEKFMRTIRNCLDARQGGVAVSALEAFCNAAVGMIVSWAATFFVLGYSASGSAAVTAMFFGLSFTRSYALRLIFRRFG